MTLSPRELELLKRFQNHLELLMGSDDSPLFDRDDDKWDKDETDFWIFLKRLKVAQ